MTDRQVDSTPGDRPELMRALRELRFNPALTADEVWETPDYHVEGIHPQAERFIVRGIDDTTRDPRSRPIGVVVEGQGGTGKTHLLGIARQVVHRNDGWFFLIDFSSGSDFWLNVARQMRGSLLKPYDGTDRSQLGVLLRRLALTAGVTNPVAEAISGSAPLALVEIQTFVRSLARVHREVVLECQQTIRALALLAAEELDLQVLGDSYFTCRPPLDDRERQQRVDWHLDPEPRHPKAVVEDLIRVAAVAGPSVIAVDQIDAWVDAATQRQLPDQQHDDQAGLDQQREGVEPFSLSELANGLMDLRQIAPRALCVASCIPVSWARIRAKAVSTVQDRYRSSLVLGTLTDPAVAEALVTRRLDSLYRRIGFTPPHPSWPVATEAFASAVDRTPRMVLQAIEHHADSCVDYDRTHELTSFAEAGSPPPPRAPAPPPAPPAARPRPSDEPKPKPPIEIAALDQRFAQLTARFDPSRALDPSTEDLEMPRLLAGGLFAWRFEQDGDRRFSVDVVTERRPDVHGRLREILDPETERQRQWSFRAIAHSNALAVQARLRNAVERSALGSPDRHLIVLRAGPWPSGPKTAQMVKQLLAMGGMVVEPTGDDLACFHALRQLSISPDPALQTWLRVRRPASATTVLQAVRIL